MRHIKRSAIYFSAILRIGEVAPAGSETLLQSIDTGIAADIEIGFTGGTNFQHSAAHFKLTIDDIAIFVEIGNLRTDNGKAAGINRLLGIDANDQLSCRNIKRTETSYGSIAILRKRPRLFIRVILHIASAPIRRFSIGKDHSARSTFEYSCSRSVDTAFKRL